MGNFGDLRIDFAKPRHLPQIIALAQQYELEGMAPRRAAELGFLVSNFEQEDYQAFLHRANHFYVLLEDEVICGFLLAYSSDRIQDDEWLNLHIKTRYPDPFIVVKQICVRPDSTGRGLASSLYQHLFSEAQECPLFAAIVLEPPNHRSVVFHEKHGFKKIFQVTPSDGIPRGVWMRRPQSVGRRFNEDDSKKG